MLQKKLSIIPNEVYNSIPTKHLVIVNELSYNEFLLKDLRLDKIIIEAYYHKTLGSKKAQYFIASFFLSDENTIRFFSETFRNLLFEIHDMKQSIIEAN